MPQSETSSRQAVSDPLLQPFRLKHLTLKNRIMSTSHACGLAEGGMPSERYQRYHETKAKGGIALTMFGGSSNVSPESAWQLPQINLYDERVVERFQRFSRRIHDHGAALMCQVSHVGGRGEPYAGAALPPIGPSPVRETLHRAFAREMDERDIARVVADFAEAAARCKEGGLDGIETFAGAHLIGQFLSPATNRRSDKFGGSVENRCRFGLMVHEAIRKRVGEDFIVGMRFLIDEAGPHHITFEDGLKIAAIFEASGTIDFFNAIYGRIDTELKLAVDCMPGMASAEAPFLAQAGAFKQAVGLPVFHATRITSLETARYAIREGLLDMVAMTRAHIADPELVAKLARGEEERVRPCVGATHCMSPLRPTCIHNPSTGHEAALPHAIERAGKRRRVLVAGGGPAGLEAARVCAERGHDVRLCEASERLGGQVLMAAQASWRSALTGIVEWRARELERLGVEVSLSSRVEPDSVGTERADVVIVATGGVPDLDWIEGAAHCTSVWEVLTGGERGRGLDRLRRDRPPRGAHGGGGDQAGGRRGRVLRPRRASRDGDVLRRAGRLAAAHLRDRHRAQARPAPGACRARGQPVARDVPQRAYGRGGGARDRPDRGRARDPPGRRPLSRPRGSLLEPRRRRSAGSARGHAAARGRGRRLPAFPHRRRGLHKVPVRVVLLMLFRIGKDAVSSRNILRRGARRNRIFHGPRWYITRRREVLSLVNCVKKVVSMAQELASQ